MNTLADLAAPAAIFDMARFSANCRRMLDHEAGVDRFGSLLVTEVHQEHGEIRGVSDPLFASLPIRAKVRIVPNNVCMTAAMYRHLNVVDDSGSPMRWVRTNGWD